VRVLLLGASGFIGSHIRTVLEADNIVDVIGLTRRPANETQTLRGTFVGGDVTDVGSLRRAMAGMDIAINASSYTGKSRDLADSVNHRGTLNLVSACKTLGVPLIQISTTAIYGSGPHRNLTVGGAEIRPESVVSRARALADDAVLQSGGTVIRPHLIYGPGDRWFIPALAKIFGHLKTRIDGAENLLSVIDAHQLGQLVAGLARVGYSHGGAFHAALPAPVTIGQILRCINDRIVPLELDSSVSREWAEPIMEALGLTRHQINLIAEDHWYNSEAIWEIARVVPVTVGISETTASWYKKYLSFSHLDWATDKKP